MAIRQDALEALRDILLTASNSEQDPIQGGWVYATEYEQVQAGANKVPFFIVDKVDGIPNQRGEKTFGVAYDRWRIQVILYLYFGDPEHPSKEGAIASKREEGWVKEFSRLLSDNQTLSNTVFELGESDGSWKKYFDYQSDYWQWDGRPYWGIRFEIPVKQYIEESTSV